MDNWKIVFSSGILYEVELARNYLESEGIETILQNELAAQIYGNAADRTKLLIKEKDVERGVKILIERGYLKTAPTA